MKIRYQPRQGFREIELRDIKGGPLAKWTNGQEREIAAGSKVPFQSGQSKVVQTDAATAVFSHGPDFVDAATGKNPLYSCADCGAEALQEHWWDLATLAPIPFVNDKGERLCITDYLAHNPGQMAEFLGRDSSLKDVVDAAKAIVAKKAPVKTTPVAAPSAQGA